MTLPTRVQQTGLLILLAVLLRSRSIGRSDRDG